jgi:dihydrofolate reductase
MHLVTCTMGVSADGFIADADGSLDWGAPDTELFRFIVDEQVKVGAYLLGRRLYETMLSWETADQDPSLGAAEIEWARLWNPLPKVVFSTTLSSVQGAARLATGDLATEIERLRAEPGDGEIAVGGAMLAGQAAAAGLIDEYRIRLSPVLLGGGVSFFPQQGTRVALDLVESRVFPAGVVFLRYRVQGH